MAASVYRLPDEPLPSGLSRYAVDPLWPMLTLMLAGNGFGLAWFAFNGFALGSPTRGRELALLALNLAGAVALLWLLGALGQAGWLPRRYMEYALLSVITLKLATGYALYMMQQRCFELWEYYGGMARNGLPLLILATLFARRLFDLQWPALLRMVLE